MRVPRDLQTWLTILCGIAMVAAMLGAPPFVAYASVGFGSYFAIRAALRSFQARTLDVNFLMVFAAAGSVALGHPLEAAILLFLFSLSSTMEAFALGKTTSAIEGLIKLRPSKAALVLPDGDSTVGVEQLKVGDRIRILPFENIPADCRIVAGSTTVNQSVMTGESMPVTKNSGDILLAGTQNLEAMVVAEVTAEAGNTLIENIVALVRDAQENKASGERISQWFGEKYTIFVIGAFFVMLVVRLLMKQPLEQSVYGALTVLVALSPCAVVISTPAATLSALAWAAQRGILIRGGAFIEIAGRIQAIAIDKTGTLTLGKPQLAEICLCTGVPEAVGARATHCTDDDGCWAEGQPLSPEARDLLRFAAAAEQYSSHPIADAVVARAKELGVDIPESHNVVVEPGNGVSAIVLGKSARIGQRRFFERDGHVLAPDFAFHAEALQRKGMTVAVLEVEGKLAALGLQDQLRPEAKELLLEVGRLGAVKQVLLTGDTQETAAAIAQQVGIKDFRAGLLPDEKADAVRSLASDGSMVMMIGDGVNDAPSMATASLGVAMGGLGSDITLNSADVVLMHDRLDRIPELMRLGRMTNRIIRANLYFASGVITFLAAASLFGDQLFPQYRNLVLPFAVVGHEGSTVLVILNGLRLLWGPGGHGTPKVFDAHG